MIYLITGRPRNGKTLYFIDTIEKKARLENRPVYYNGITGITFDNWFELKDATKWKECPQSSIIVFDECQKNFRNRSATSAPPAHVVPLNEHGHYGYDMYFISQAPKFVDPDVKGLTQEHHHVVRHFGREKATIHRWDVVKENPDSKVNKADSIKKTFVFPKHRYSAYHSSTDHNVKENVPWKYHMIKIAFVIALLLVGKVAYSWLYSDHSSLKKHEVAETEKTPETKPSELKPLQPTYKDTKPQPSDLTYIQAYKPEIADIMASAPIYREIAKPTTFPKPAACVIFKNKCQCYTQQATSYPTTDTYCRNIVKNGYFDDTYQPDQNQQASQPTVQPIS